MARSVTIELVVDSKGAVTSIKSVDGSLVNLRQTADDEGKKFGRIMDTAWGVAIANFAARAADALLQVVPQLFKLATAAEETGNKFNVTFGEAADRVNDFLSTWTKLAGVTVTAGREMTSMLGSIFQGFRFTKEAAADLSIDITRLAGDFVSFHNIPMEEALAALRSGITGEIEPLSRLGIKFGEADVKMRAAIMTSKALNSQFTQGELVLARVAEIMERSKLVHGDLANTQNSTANQARQAYGRMQTAAENLATSLMPIWASLSVAANEFMTDNEEAIGQTIESIGKALVFTASTVTAFVSTVADMGKLIKENKEVALSAAGVWLLYETAVNRAKIAQIALNFVTKANPWVFLATAVVTAISALKIFGFTSDEIKVIALESAVDIEKMRRAFLRLASSIYEVTTFGGATDFFGVKAGVDAALGTAERNIAVLEDDIKRLRGSIAMEAGQQGKSLGQQLLDSVDLTGVDERLKKILEDMMAQFDAERDAILGAKNAAKEHIQTLEDVLAARQKLADSDALEEDAIKVGDAIESVDEKWQRLQETFRADAAAADSIREINAQLATLNEMLLAVSSPEHRAQIQAVIDALNGLKIGMEGGNEAAEEKARRTEQLVHGVNAAIQGSIVDMVDNLAEALTKADGLGDVGEVILGQMADLAERVGKLLVGFGAAGVALKRFVENPLTAIFAGTALIALAKVAKAAISNEVKSGGGGFASHHSSPEFARQQQRRAAGLNATGIQGSVVAPGVAGVGVAATQKINVGVDVTHSPIDVNVTGETKSHGTELVHTFKATTHRSKRTGNS